MVYYAVRTKGLSTLDIKLIDSNVNKMVFILIPIYRDILAIQIFY